MEPAGKPVVPKNHTHRHQPSFARRSGLLEGRGFGGSSTGERNPPKYDRLIAEMAYHAVTHFSTAKAVVSCVGG
jgi:hypothetical protein